VTKLTIELPDEVAGRLAEQARFRGRTVEEEVKGLVLDRYPPAELPRESKEAILKRMQERWKEVKNDAPVSPEEMKEWINYGRP
jgi:hypothetical protein